jgi:hemerythrin-like domain-containing protein
MPTSDLVELLIQEHATLRSLLSRLDAPLGGVGRTSRNDARVVYLELSDRTIRHEIAEELVVFPAFVANRQDAEAADSALQEHSIIEDQLTVLDRQEFGSSEFERTRAELTGELLAHLEREETRVLPILASRIGGRRQVEVVHRYRQVIRVAPLLSAQSRAQLPTGPTVVARTSALAVWMRDVAHSTGLAG